MLTGNGKRGKLSRFLADAVYQFIQLKSDKDTESKVEKISITVPQNESASAQAGLMQGIAIADGMDLTKLLADLPGNICTPTYLAEQALELGEKYDKLTINILEESDMDVLGMGRSCLYHAAAVNQPN